MPLILITVGIVYIVEEDCIGCGAVMYMQGEQGGLAAQTRIVSQAAAVSPRMLLEELFFGPIAAETHASALPAGVSALDVLGVSVADGIAGVNLSGNAYRRFQSLDEAGERNAAYAIVNTLCQLDEIRAVKIYIEGASTERMRDLK